jgi:hypothetical protein
MLNRSERRSEPDWTHSLKQALRAGVEAMHDPEIAEQVEQHFRDNPNYTRDAVHVCGDCLPMRLRKRRSNDGESQSRARSSTVGALATKPFAAPKAPLCSSAMARSLTQTKINSTYSTSPEPMSQQIDLTQFGLMAERHWREFRPTMVRELEALTRKLETEQGLTMQQA